MKIKLNQEGRLVMTLALKQALEILQMPQLQLALRLREEIEKNPLLEYTPSKTFPLPHDSLLPAPIQLHDHLLIQIREYFSSPADQTIAIQLLNHLDERGFLAPPFPFPPETVDPILAIMQTFDPPGICARNLQESLLLQLKAQNKTDSPLYRLIRDHFPELLAGKHKKIGSIQHLTFNPAHSFKDEPVPTLIPDLKISKLDSQWTIELNQDELPQFTFHENYTADSPEEKETLRSYTASAKWLIRSLSRRSKLLKEIALYLVRKQSRYLDQKGPLTPVTMKEISIDLQIHESTLSRALSEKYISTPRGIFPLRFFFSLNLEAKEALQRLIAQEDKKLPLTDDQLSLELRSLGHKLARRTVAKYRRLLKIGSATQRKALH